MSGAQVANAAAARVVTQQEEVTIGQLRLRLLAGPGGPPGWVLRIDETDLPVAAGFLSEDFLRDLRAAVAAAEDFLAREGG